MSVSRKRIIVLSLLLFQLVITDSYAGPPFTTDDPDPVLFKHWEYYISSQSTFQSNIWAGTLPHFEVNYGLVPNVQVHLLIPFNYAHIPHQGIKFGYADTEIGIKYCFIHETENTPQVGTFPIIEIPTVKNDEFSTGKVKVFIPLWVQKSWNKFTTYGGVGYRINPGTKNKNSFFSGWELQYDFSKSLTLGGELYYQSPETEGEKSMSAFNIGGSINASQKVHFIFSFGHSLSNTSFSSSYVGILWTI